MAEEIQQIATNGWDALQVIGTATLPALITYFITRSNNEKEIKRIEKEHENELIKIEKAYKRDANKYKLDIKIKILQEATALIQEYFVYEVDLINIWFNLSESTQGKDIYFHNIESNQTIYNINYVTDQEISMEKDLIYYHKESQN